MVNNKAYEQEIERIGPKLEELEGRPFDEIMKGLYDDVFGGDLYQTVVFALTYILAPSRFYIEVNYREGVRYYINFAADTSIKYFGSFVRLQHKSDERPTDEEARGLIKKFLPEGDIVVKGLLEKAYGVVDTCKVIQD